MEPITHVTIYMYKYLYILNKLPTGHPTKSPSCFKFSSVSPRTVQVAQTKPVRSPTIPKLTSEGWAVRGCHLIYIIGAPKKKKKQTGKS